MKKTKHILYLFFLLVSTSLHAQRMMEYLDRGVVAVRNAPDSVFISWRLLGTEPENLPFNVYRTTGNGKAVKLNVQPLTKGTNFTDTKADSNQNNTYTIKAIVNGKE